MRGHVHKRGKTWAWVVDVGRERSRATDTYHHGNLPNALRRAAAEVIQEGGLSSFSLREVARRAGVSHTAPAHHFGDSRGLLTSLAAEGFVQLHSVLAEVAAEHDDPVERLVALGASYVQFARRHGGHCEVMFRMDFVDPDDSDLMACGLTAYGVLEDAVGSVIDAVGSDVDLDMPPGCAGRPCRAWSCSNRRSTASPTSGPNRIGPRPKTWSPASPS